MDGKSVFKAVVTVLGLLILVPVAALIVGTILTQSVFSSLTIINTTVLEGYFSTFVTGFMALISVIGVVVGLVWLVGYIKPLFDKKSGIQSFAGA